MVKHGEQHPLSNFMHPLPVLTAQWDAPPLDDSRDDAGVDLKSYLATLYDSRWMIGFITAVITTVAVIYALVATPVYEANLIIHVEGESSHASKNIASESTSLSEAKNTATSEMALLRSRMVVARAVDKLQSFIDVQPKYFPVAAFWFAGQHRGMLSEPGLFGYGGYVWGGEEAQVSVFNVPESLLDREFVITAQSRQRYRISGGGQRIMFDGLVGERYTVQTPEGPIDIRIDSMRANPGAVFYLKRQSSLGTIEAIQQAMVITEQGKQSGVIEVKLQGENAQKITALLTEIGQEYMRQNLAWKTEEEEKSLAFVNTQLPLLKRQLEESEERYNRFRNTNGTVDLHEEARMNLQQAVAARTRRTDLMEKKAELLARFTEDHPVVAAVNRQSKEVDGNIDEIASRIKALPVLEQDEARLTRDIKVNTDLYITLSNTAQRLRLLSVGRVNNVRMIDEPIVPEKPLTPNRPLIVALAVLIGLLLGIIASFVRKAINRGFDDPHKIERLLRARVVYATIPHSKNQNTLTRKIRTDSVSVPLLAQMMPEDPAIESLRGFRAALQFSMPHFKNNIVMLTGPTRHLGKSFIAANFAAVVAASGKRVLLIDADLRNGRLHRYFGVQCEPGLAEVINGVMLPEEAIHHDVIDNLDFMATGVFPLNRSEFLLHLNLDSLLETVSQHYDLVLVDPAPILSVADSLIIGAHAGAVFIVACSGMTTENELNESIKRLNHAGISTQGVLFNDMSSRMNFLAASSVYGKHVQIEHAN